MKLKGKTVVVTGGTSGLGFATALLAAEEGASVVIAARDQRSVDDALAQLPMGSKGSAINVLDETSYKKFFSEIGTVDHLVYTAGDNPGFGAVATFNLEQAMPLLAVRYWGFILAVKLVLSHMSHDGSINTVTGTLRQNPLKGLALISGTSGAIEGLVSGMAVDFAPIRVNAVSVGAVFTPGWGITDQIQKQTAMESVIKSNLLGRMGEPSDVAQAFLF